MTPPRPQPNDPPTTRRIIDFQLSLASIVSGAVIVGTFMVWMGWQAAQQTTNMAQLQQAVVKVEKRLDSRDQYQDSLRDTVFELRNTNNIHVLRITELERTVRALESRK